MATAPVSIAPVLTPYTLGVLADSFEYDHLSEQALFLRKLLPFVEGVIEKCFLPLLAQREEKDFLTHFDKLSRDFEPFRIYINIQLFSILGNQNSLALYEQTLLGSLDLLMRTAGEMDMEPELISAAVRDYVKILQAIHYEAMHQTVGVVSLETSEMDVERFTKLIDWLHTASRLDYGLTTVFLVLEKSMPMPASQDKSALLAACKESLLDFGQATSKLFVQAPIQRALQELKTPHIKIKPVRNGIRTAATSPVENTATKPAFGSSGRQIEINWLIQHKDLSDRYGGQWIVLEKDELVANDTDYGKARLAAAQRGIKRPFIIFVPLKESGAFMGI